MWKEIKFWFKVLKLYIGNILVAIDQFVGTLVGLDPDETISSFLGKNREKWWARHIVYILDSIDNRHTTKYLENDEGSYSVWTFISHKEEIKKKMR